MLGIALLTGWAMNFGGQEASATSVDPTAGLAHLVALVDADRHPHLSALLAAESTSEREPMHVEETFRWGVNSLLSGCNGVDQNAVRASAHRVCHRGRSAERPAHRAKLQHLLGRLGLWADGV